jgi:hypothetical protein
MHKKKFTAEKIVKTVENSQRIEGYQPVQTAAVKERARALMEQYHVQVSPRK